MCSSNFSGCTSTVLTNVELSAPNGGVVAVAEAGVYLLPLCELNMPCSTLLVRIPRHNHRRNDMLTSHLKPASK